MREIKIRVPQGQAKAVAALAHDAGIQQVASHEVYVHGEGQINDEVKIKSSTPQVKAFLSALLRAPFYDPKTCPFSSHNVRAFIDGHSMDAVTRPVYIPPAEIQADFWLYSHITWSFVIRTSVSAGLLAYGLIKDDKVISIGAMIFSPFSPLILAAGFAAVIRDRALWKQALKAFAAALALTVVSAAVIAHAAGGPLLFNRFGNLSTNVLISAITGLMAAVADADDIGRRQLLGLAMAYPFVKFPVWLGIACVLGFPDAATTLGRLAALVCNAAAMSVCAAAAYWLMGRHGELQKLANEP